MSLARGHSSTFATRSALSLPAPGPEKFPSCSEPCTQAKWSFYCALGLPGSSQHLDLRLPFLQGPFPWRTLIICLDVFVLWIYSSSFCPPSCLLKLPFLSISFTWVGALPSKADFSTPLHPAMWTIQVFPSRLIASFFCCCSGTGTESLPLIRYSSAAFPLILWILIC